MLWGNEPAQGRWKTLLTTRVDLDSPAPPQLTSSDSPYLLVKDPTQPAGPSGETALTLRTPSLGLVPPMSVSRNRSRPS